jgi:predicted Zn-dependent peptidase
MDGPTLVFSKLAATAFEAHPYRNPSAGWPGDLNNMRRGDARAFLEKYYVPRNVSIVIVGDVNPAEAKRFATQYFGSWAARPVPGGVRTLEPQQLGPKRAALEAHPAPGRPNPTMMAAVGYKRPSQYDHDDAALDILQIVLGQGKTGLLHKELVTERHLAQSVQVRATFPAGHYPNLFLVAMVAAQGHTVEENEKALDEYLNRLKQQRMELPVIDRAKAQARVVLVNRLSSNAGIAGLLGNYQAEYGDWRKLFANADSLAKVSADDLQRVLQRYFVPTSRTTVYTILSGQPETALVGGNQ